ncbi:hypothetical protein CBR_g3742 [Chara braunii]|uniref:SGNH hydrolase-type esterase domain-containing protein n=1 Tax=Chara braunii TaxID=69332 RepID=A0A388KG52_CHABU|nr:hypothetical protein CBR_g3742 [Chara braunii]|eukprot:GBG69044.1 hypothetical protein CBR_g3742 [Chara braunii]
MASTPRRRDHASSFSSVLPAYSPSPAAPRKRDPHPGVRSLLPAAAHLEPLLQSRLAWFLIGVLTAVILNLIFTGNVFIIATSPPERIMGDEGPLAREHQVLIGIGTGTGSVARGEGRLGLGLGTEQGMEAREEAIAEVQAQQREEETDRRQMVVAAAAAAGAAVGGVGVGVGGEGGGGEGGGGGEREAAVAVKKLAAGNKGDDGLSGEGGVRPRFVLFGDSLTQQSFGPGGWGAALADQYARKVDVICRGYSGYNTRWAMYLLPRVFPSPIQRANAVKTDQTPLLATIFFGANDLALPYGSSKRQHVPLKEYKSNLRKMVTHVMSLSPAGTTTGVRVVLITTPPIDEEGRLAYAREKYGVAATQVPERTNEVAKLYADACKEVGEDMAAETGGRVGVVDLWNAIQRIPNWRKVCLRDGLHFTPAGNEVVFAELMHVLTSFAGEPSLHPDSLPFDFPLHTLIDSDNPALVFRAI